MSRQAIFRTYLKNTGIFEIMRITYFIPGGFISFLIAFFIRLWAVDHGHLFLARLAFIYMAILLIPAAIVILVALLAIIIFMFMQIFLRIKRF